MNSSLDSLVEKEFQLIQEISRNPHRTQRDLSLSVGLSLGMTNLLIKRLARKGLIKVSQLDWNRTQYLLTFKGAMEKTRKSYRYSLYTIRVFRQIRENISVALSREYATGHRDFAVVAQDEILELIQELIEEFHFPRAQFAFLRRMEEVPSSATVVLIALPGPAPKARHGQKYIPLVDFGNIDFRIGESS